MANAATITAATPLPAGGGATAPAASERVDPARVIAFLAMCFGMFMAFLDIQVVSASLSEIQAGLGASNDEITWVQTSYLMAEVVAIPLSGFLSRALGTRIMFASAAAGFTFASLMCGLTSTMGQMIVWRALQGFIGGGMVPTVFASAYSIFPRSKQPIVTPLIGLVATLAPTIGPTVGGYLTDLASWHWLFFINIVPGIMVTIAAITLIDFDQPNFSLFEPLRLGRPHLHGAVPGHARIRAGRWATLRLVRGPDGRHRRGHFRKRGGDLFRARAHGAAADRRSAGIRRPQFCGRQHVLIRARHRALRPDLSLSDLSRADPRLQRTDDRPDPVRLRRHDVSDRAAGRPADDQSRRAADAGVRIFGRCAEQLANDLSDQRIGSSGSSSCRNCCAASA